MGVDFRSRMESSDPAGFLWFHSRYQHMYMLHRVVEVTIKVKWQCRGHMKNCGYFVTYLSLLPPPPRDKTHRRLNHFKRGSTENIDGIHGKSMTGLLQGLLSNDVQNLDGTYMYPSEAYVRRRKA